MTAPFPAIPPAEPEASDPLLWVRLWRSLDPAEWAVLAVALPGLWALFWWLCGDPVLAVFVLAAVTGTVATAAVLAWFRRELLRQRRRVSLVESWQCSDRAELLDHVGRERNTVLDAGAAAKRAGRLAVRSVPGQRTDDGGAG